MIIQNLKTQFPTGYALIFEYHGNKYIKGFPTYEDAQQEYKRLDNKYTHSKNIKYSLQRL